MTYFEINQIQGTDPEKLDEASLNALKDDDVLTERAADPNAVLLTDAIRANNPFYEQLIDLIDARLAVVNTPALTDVVYLSRRRSPSTLRTSSAAAWRWPTPSTRTRICTRTSTSS